MKIFLFVTGILLAGFYSCRDAAAEKEKAHADSLKTIMRADSIVAAQTSTHEDSLYILRTGALVPDSALFYPVYELSPGTQAIVMEVWFNPSYSAMDSLMQSIVNSGIYDPETISPLKGFADSSGRFYLLQDKQVTAKLSAFLEGEFFIYCEKGVVKRKVKDVLFSADMCQSSFFAFRFDAIDKAEYGNPLLASRKNTATPAKDDKAEQLIHHYNDSLVMHIRDFSDTLPPKIFAVQDSVYFVYYDDFRWPFDANNKSCYFPGRAQYVIRHGTAVELKQWDMLDLFGVPCD